MATLADIEKKTKTYADARDLLVERVRALKEELEQIKNEKLPGIKKTLAKVAEAEAALRAMLEESAALFEKPRTQIFNGVKVGYMKGKGKISWEDDEAVVKLIKKRFPEQADVLTRTTTVPDKQALAGLTAAELKRLGVTVDESGDVVVIKPVDGEVEKTVAALLKGAAEEAEAAPTPSGVGEGDFAA